MLGRIKYQEAAGLEVKRVLPPSGPVLASDQLTGEFKNKARRRRCSKE